MKMDFLIRYILQRCARVTPVPDKLYQIWEYKIIAKKTKKKKKKKTEIGDNIYYKRNYLSCNIRFYSV